MCGCGFTGHHGGYHRGHHAGYCGCGQPPHIGMYLPKEDQVARLERYLENLQAEAKGVEERIAQMKEE